MAALAGARPVGLVPKRRTAIIVELPNGADTRGWPAVDEVGYGCYCKPETGRVMASPADATPVEPGDVQPEDLDVAVVADWLERSTHIPVRRIARKWAGLRCFVADDGPVCGFDDSRRRLLLAVRPGRLRHHDGVLARPHRRQLDCARGIARGHRDRWRNDIRHRAATDEAIA